jgi:hypothetical protein
VPTKGQTKGEAGDKYSQDFKNDAIYNPVFPRKNSVSERWAAAGLFETLVKLPDYNASHQILQVVNLLDMMMMIIVLLLLC